jgi:hypothetical protein
MTRVARAVLLVYGGYLVGLSVLMVVAPDVFFEQVGPYGTQNDHYIRDVATFQGVLGVVALWASPQRALHAPALGLLALQSGLHALSHLWDIDEATPAWLGVVEAVALVLVTLLLGGLAARSRSRESTETAEATSLRR